MGRRSGYTLYYATNLIFTGLAVAIAYHAGLFNIGGEGQAYLGGLGLGLVGIYLGWLPGILSIPLAVLAAALFGGVWGLIPGWLQARRGSHVVITTIMLNFVASALMTYLMVNVLIKPGQSAPESITFPESASGCRRSRACSRSSASISATRRSTSRWSWRCCAASACGCSSGAAGSAMRCRVVGHSEAAAVYGGISPAARIILAMTLSGALAGLMASNEILGGQHRIILGFSGGYGFAGIAVALMGRNHPVGVVSAALLFGALYQGGTELAFDMPRINKDLVVVIQGLVILFAGALENLFRPQVEALFARRPHAAVPA